MREYGWWPIADEYSYAFKGNYDGGGFSIFHLYSAYSESPGSYSSSHGGFMYYLGTGTVQNVNIVDANFSYIVYPSFIQSCDGGTITNCNFSGNLCGYFSGGGICSSFSGGKISNCTVSGSLTAMADSGTEHVGGLVGTLGDSRNSQTILIKNCVSKLYITVFGESTMKHVGGFAGVTASGENITLENCVFKGHMSISAFSSSYSQIGGMVGDLDGEETIKNCSVVATCNYTMNCFAQNESSSYLKQATACYSQINNKKMYLDGDFSGFTVVNGMNEGLPMQNDLFNVAVGGQSSASVISALKNKGFVAFSS